VPFFLPPVDFFAIDFFAGDVFFFALATLRVFAKITPPTAIG